MELKISNKIPFIKSPFKEEDLYNILKVILDGNYDNTINLAFLELLYKIKQTNNILLYNNFDQTLLDLLKIIKLTKGDYLLVSELFPQELQNNLENILGIHIIRIPCLIGTLNIDLKYIDSLDIVYQAVYLDYPLVYENHIEYFSQNNIYIIINDSNFLNQESSILEDIKKHNTPESTIFTITCYNDMDIITLGGSGTSVQIFGEQFKDIININNSAPISYLLGLAQLEKVDDLISNRKAIIQEYLKYFSHFQDTHNTKNFLYISDIYEALSLKETFKERLIEIKTFKEYFNINNPEQYSKVIQYYCQYSIFLPVYPTLSKQDTLEVIHILKYLN